MRGARIRVVHLINHLGYGGTERQLLLVLRHFDPKAFHHRVVVFNPSPEKVYDEALRGAGIEVVNLPEDCRGILRRLRHLTSCFRRWRPHVVHSWTVHDNPYAGVAGFLAGVPARWGSLRGSLRSEGLRRQPWWSRVAMLRTVQRIVVNSSALRAELAAAGVPEERILLLPNCVAAPPNVSPADLSDLGIDPEDKVVGMVGNLRAVKNHELFVRAMARVLPTRPGARAVLVGQPIASEPDYGEQIVGLIEDLGLGDRVILTGFRDDVPSILERLSVLCLTSHTEGMPNAVLEAMAAGVPVVAVRVGGVPDLIDHEVHGLVVAQGDEAAFAAAVGKLLDHADLARSLGQEAKRRARTEFGCAAAARRLAEAYLRTRKGSDVSVGRGAWP